MLVGVSICFVFYLLLHTYCTVPASNLHVVYDATHTPVRPCQRPRTSGSVPPGPSQHTSHHVVLRKGTSELLSLSLCVCVCTTDQGPSPGLSNGGPRPQARLTCHLHQLKPAPACSWSCPPWGQREPSTTEREKSSLGGRLYGLLPPWDLIYFVVLFLLAPYGRLSCVTSQIDYTHKLRCGRGRP